MGRASPARRWGASSNVSTAPTRRAPGPAAAWDWPSWTSWHAPTAGGGLRGNRPPAAAGGGGGRPPPPGRPAGAAPGGAASLAAARAALGDRMPLRGPWTVTVPGAIRSWGDAHARVGRLSWPDLLAPAGELGEGL